MNTDLAKKNQISEKENEGEEGHEEGRNQQKGKKGQHEKGSEKEVDIAVGLKKDIVYMVDKDSQSISAIDLRTDKSSCWRGGEVAARERPKRQEKSSVHIVPTLCMCSFHMCSALLFP